MLDDFEKIRQSRAFPRPTPAPPGPGGSAAFVGVVTTAAPAVGTFVEVSPATVGGDESEGGAGVLATGDAATSIPVYILGSAVPATGDALVCRFVDHRWVAERMAGTGCAARLRVPVIGCPAFGDSCNHSTPHPLVGLADCTVTATKGAFSASGTTVGPINPFFGGNVDLDLSGGGAGVYTVTISRPRYATITTDFNVGCFTAGMPYQVMAPDADHACCLIHASGDSSPTCATAVPRTLHATTQAGDVTLTAVFGTIIKPGGCIETLVRWEGTIAGATYDTLVFDGYGNCGAGSFTGDLDVKLYCPNDAANSFATANTGFPGGDGWMLAIFGQSCGFERGVMSKIPIFVADYDGCAEPIDLSFPGGQSRPPFDTGVSTVTE